MVCNCRFPFFIGSLDLMHNLGPSFRLLMLAGDKDMTVAWDELSPMYCNQLNVIAWAGRGKTGQGRGAKGAKCKCRRTTP